MRPAAVGYGRLRTMFAFFISSRAPSRALFVTSVILSACSGHEPDPVQSGTGGAESGGVGSGGDAPVTGSGGAPASGGATSAPAVCENYVDGFRPQVFVPVCSHCHGQQSNIPDLGVASVAIANCSTIGSVISRGVMPPDGSGLTLTAEQRTLIADWVAAGCPETAADAAQVCTAAPAGSGGTGAGTGGTPSTGGTATTPPASGLTVDRAEWDADKQSLRIEGTVDDTGATLVAEFTGRTEPLTNDGGRFKSAFDGVVVRPPAVTVTASSGASATAAVVAK
jgi:hypothetical protein